MLGKLLKNEFKSTAHRVSWIYMVGAATLLILMLGYVTDKTWLGALASIVLIIVGAVVLLVTLVAVIAQYNSSMFGAEGYLSFTLPVSSRSLLTSKFLVSSTWILLSYFFAIGTCVITIVYADRTVSDSTQSILQMLLEVYGIYSTNVLIEIAVFFLVDMFLGIMFTVSAIYFCLSLSNTRIFQQHSVLSAIIFYLALILVDVFLLYYATAYLPMTVYFNGEHIAINFAKSMATGDGFGAGSLLVHFVLSLILLSGTKYLIENKTNVK